MTRSPSSPPRVARASLAAEPCTSLIDLLLSDGDVPERIDGVVIGTLEGLDADGRPTVRFALHPDPQHARTTTPLGTSDIGREVALLFEQGDPTRPIVMGRMHDDGGAARTARVDGARVELAAEREIVLRCGQASLTLTRAGKVLIKGAFVLTDATGVNRIRGGSVQIN